MNKSTLYAPRLRRIAEDLHRQAEAERLAGDKLGAVGVEWDAKWLEVTADAIDATMGRRAADMTHLYATIENLRMAVRTLARDMATCMDPDTVTKRLDYHDSVVRYFPDRVPEQAIAADAIRVARQEQSVKLARLARHNAHTITGYGTAA